MKSETPKVRHWFRFSLRTLFVAMTVLGLCLGWIARELRTVHGRAEMIDWCQANEGTVLNHYEGRFDPNFLESLNPEPRELSWIRGACGDQRVKVILLPSPLSLERQQELARLFPETYLAIGEGSGIRAFYDPTRAADR
jgi:hypothetical protein